MNRRRQPALSLPCWPQTTVRRIALALMVALTLVALPVTSAPDTHSARSVQTRCGSCDG